MKKLKPISKPTPQSWPIADRWLKFFEEHPYGDYYRLSIINPLIFQVALWARRRKEGPIEKQAHLLPPPPVDLGTAIFAQLATDSKTPHDTFESFHNKILELSDPNVQPLRGLRIADFGCGNGYLAPLLGAMGAAYCGLDKEPGFISAAKKHYNLDKKASFLVADLDVTPQSQLRSFLGDIDLALSVMVLEHLKNPLFFLEHLRMLSTDDALPPALLLVTENPYYYGEGLLASEENGRYLRPTKSVPIVCLGGDSVEINYREHDAVATLLRDAGYTVLQEGYHHLPGKWDAFPRQHYNCEHLKNVNWGLAPFRSILAVPLPKPNDEGRIKIPELISNTVLRKLSNKDQKSLLKEICAEGKFVRLAPRQPLLTRHDLGGCLFVVTDGQLSSANEPEAVFNQFDWLGELEANRGSTEVTECGYFIHDVTAGETGAEVFVIPEQLASQLLETKSSLLSYLFSELRRKVLLRNDRVTLRRFNDKSYRKNKALNFSSELRRVNENAPEGHQKDIPKHLINELVLQTTNIPFHDIQKYDLGRFAGALLNLSEIEAQSSRRVHEARAVFCDLGHLQGIADIRDVTENAGAKFLRFLCVLGVLDSVPVGLLKSFHDGSNMPLDERLAVDLKKYIQTRASTALNAMVKKNVISKQEAIVYESKVSLLASNSLEGECFRKKKGKHRSQTTRYFASMQALVSECSHSLEKLDVTIRSEILKPIVEAANQLLQLNILIKDEKPRFILIHDLPFLRTLAYAPCEEVDRALIVRALAHRRFEKLAYNNFERVATDLARADDAHGRIRYYAAAFVQFLRDDWENGGRLRYSGGGTEGVELPQHIVL